LSKEELEITLGDIRTDIAALRLEDEMRTRLTEVMSKEFGGLEGYGVFVRSDTNVEDLPEFTGAGLSETVPNVVGLEAQLATVPRVWSSVLSPRALAWRSSLLSNPEQVYASVLLMKSVASDKSGVLVIANLIDPLEPGITASAAWGVGGAVAGEAAESIVILPDSVRLVSEAKAPYQRQLAGSGGVTWVPAASGRVLADNEIEQLRALAEEVVEKYVPVLNEAGKPRPWDIEFGFVDGELTLFQIRPLVEKSTQRAGYALHRLRPEVPALVGEAAPVDLAVTIGGQRQ
jgi:phosphoenolpyruvate synthase/pyruvate phosphate dikinase